MAITSDGSQLLVAETYGNRITAFDVASDGSLDRRRVFADLEARRPDGICLDASGAVWVGSFATEEFLRVREGGEIIEIIETPGRWAVSCALGGVDGRDLSTARRFNLAPTTTRTAAAVAESSEPTLTSLASGVPLHDHGRLAAFATLGDGLSADLSSSSC